MAAVGRRRAQPEMPWPASAVVRSIGWAGTLTFLLFILPPAAAQGLPGPGGHGLFLTDKVLEQPAVGDFGDVVYEMKAFPSAPSAVPMALSTPAATYTLEFEHHPSSRFVFTDDATLHLPVSCRHPTTGLYQVSLYVLLMGPSGGRYLATSSSELPLVCDDQVTELALPVKARGLFVFPGEWLEVGISTGNPSVPEEPSLTVLVGDPDRPAGLVGNTTTGPVFLPVQAHWAWDDYSLSGQARFFATNAAGAILRVTGNLSASSPRVTLEIRNAIGQGTIFAKTWTEEARISLEDVLPAGSGTRWEVVVSGSVRSGYVDVELVPATIEVKEEIAPPVATTSAGPATSGADAVKSSPMPWAFVAVAVASLLARPGRGIQRTP